MGITEIRSDVLPKLSEDTKKDINSGLFYLYELDGEYPFAVCIDQEAYLLNKKGRVVKIVPDKSLAIRNLVYFADLPRPKSMFDLAVL